MPQIDASGERHEDQDISARILPRTTRTWLSSLSKLGADFELLRTDVASPPKRNVLSDKTFMRLSSYRPAYRDVDQQSPYEQRRWLKHRRLRFELVQMLMRSPLAVWRNVLEHEDCAVVVVGAVAG